MCKKRKLYVQIDDHEYACSRYKSQDLIVINIGEIMKLIAIYNAYKDSDKANDNMCALERYILMM